MSIASPYVCACAYATHARVHTLRMRVCIRYCQRLSIRMWMRVRLRMRMRRRLCLCLCVCMCFVLDSPCVCVCVCVFVSCVCVCVCVSYVCVCLCVCICACVCVCLAVRSGRDLEISRYFDPPLPASTFLLSPTRRLMCVCVCVCVCVVCVCVCERERERERVNRRYADAADTQILYFFVFLCFFVNTRWR
jgi:hypothetical protein